MSKKNTFETEESKLSFFFYVPNLKKKQKFKTSVLPAQEPTKKKNAKFFPGGKNHRKNTPFHGNLLFPEDSFASTTASTSGTSNTSGEESDEALASASGRCCRAGLGLGVFP